MNSDIASERNVGRQLRAALDSRTMELGEARAQLVQLHGALDARNVELGDVHAQLRNLHADLVRAREDIARHEDASRRGSKNLLHRRWSSGRRVRGCRTSTGVSTRCTDRGVGGCQRRSARSCDGFEGKITTVPAVSVIVPCYNLGEFLDDAVDSVLSQTWQDFEILIVDDGSTEAFTSTLLANYTRPNTRVIRTPHRGLAAARNAGIEQASGRYLSRWTRTMACCRLPGAALDVLKNDPQLTFCSAWLRTFGDQQWDWTPARCDLPTLLWEDTVLTAALVRRADVVALGGYDTAMPEQGDEDGTCGSASSAAVAAAQSCPRFSSRPRRPGSMSTVCWYRPGHLPLLRYRVGKFAALYDQHLRDVLLHQDEATATLLRRNDELERQLMSHLEPALASRQAELQSLESRLARVEQPSRHLSHLETALAASVAEVDAFKHSMSWRVTAPLRTVYGWWLKWTGA